MNKILKKLAHTFKRHPFLYFVRYVLLSKNYNNICIDALGCFNDINTINAIPKLYFEINSQIAIDPKQDEFDKALVIGKFLRSRIKGGAGLGLSSEKTLKMMLAGHGGVCSDFAQVFNIFCFINGIRVKEWGIVDSLYKAEYGHSFNEIYSTKQQKWIVIDIIYGIIFEDTIHHNFFSAIDLFHNLRNGNVLVAKHYSDFTSETQYRIPLVYAKKTIPFLVVNKENGVVDYYYNKLQNLMPILIINVLLFILRKNQTFIFVLDDYRVKLLPKYFQK